MKTGFLFPGQGAQFVGMGAEIAEKYPAAAEIFAKANDIVGYDLRSICFNGPAEKLNMTAVSQPAIFVTSVAMLEAFTGQIKPDVTAGLSLGEYTALYAAGVISFEDGLVLCGKRGQAMQTAAQAQEGTMLSIIGLEKEQVDELCGKVREEGEILDAVNFNCPGQIVVSGSRKACGQAEKLAVEYGAVKAIPLEVAGAFHTEMMASAAEKLEEAIAKVEISDPADVKIVANINAEYYTTSADIAKGLVKQLTGAILWQKSMERLLAEGVEQFYEIGPGRVLTGLMRRISRKTKVVNVGKELKA